MRSCVGAALPLPLYTILSTTILGEFFSVKVLFWQFFLVQHQAMTVYAYEQPNHTAAIV